MGCAMIFASNRQRRPRQCVVEEDFDPAPAQQEARAEALALAPPHP